MPGSVPDIICVAHISYFADANRSYIYTIFFLRTSVIEAKLSKGTLKQLSNARTEKKKKKLKVISINQFLLTA